MASTHRATDTLASRRTFWSVQLRQDEDWLSQQIKTAPSDLQMPEEHRKFHTLSSRQPERKADGGRSSLERRHWLWV